MLNLISEKRVSTMQQAYNAVDEYIHRNNLETAAGLAEMYQDYIDGKKELKDINMEFRRGYSGYICPW